MGRPRLFDRESVLQKTMPVFWKRGYADTTVQDLEKATGVNKSGLYSEFKDKDELFIASLKFYYETRTARKVLDRKPLGWTNIQTFFEQLLRSSTAELKGCFGVATMRELDQLPPEARRIVIENRSKLKRLWAKNIAVEKPHQSPQIIAELVSTFFSGFCINQNLKITKASLRRQVEDFIAALKAL
jgi:AcrR family transcriptional regulator